MPRSCPPFSSFVPSHGLPAHLALHPRCADFQPGYHCLERLLEFYTRFIQLVRLFQLALPCLPLFALLRSVSTLVPPYVIPQCHPLRFFIPNLSRVSGRQVFLSHSASELLTVAEPASIDACEALCSLRGRTSFGLISSNFSPSKFLLWTGPF